MEVLSVIALLFILYYFAFTVLLCLLDCDVALAIAEKIGKKLDKLAGKVVWITGASSGIGEAMACEVARHGGKLVLSARREAQLQRVRDKCLQANSSLTPADILLLPMDITKVEEHQVHFDRVLLHFGQLDILVNNAGRSQRANWESVHLEVDQQLFQLNVFSVVHLSRIAIKYFTDRGKGHIAVTSSIAGLIGAPYSGSYTASKHAIHGYFDSLRNEKLGTKLTVTILCPGPTFTNFLAESFTANPNEKFGQSAMATDRRMTAERCAQLSLIAIVNKMDQVWMAVFPVLPLVYALLYMPYIAGKITKLVGQRQFQQLRDSRPTVTVHQA